MPRVARDIQEKTAEQDETVLVGARRKHFKTLERITDAENVAEKPILAEKVSVCGQKGGKGACCES